MKDDDSVSLASTVTYHVDHSKTCITGFESDEETSFTCADNQHQDFPICDKEDDVILLDSSDDDVILLGKTRSPMLKSTDEVIVIGSFPPAPSTETTDSDDDSILFCSPFKRKSKPSELIDLT